MPPLGIYGSGVADNNSSQEYFKPHCNIKKFAIILDYSKYLCSIKILLFIKQNLDAVERNN